MSKWVEAVEENRKALETLAEQGRTELAEDARRVLAEADEKLNGG